MYFQKFGVRNKYGARKTTVDGVVFDSQKEANDYEVLRWRERAGEIRDLKRQVAFVIVDKSEYGRALKYVADFTYTDCETGEFVVADSKGGVRTDVYKLKKRLLAERYGIVIKEL